MLHSVKIIVLQYNVIGLEAYTLFCVHVSVFACLIFHKMFLEETVITSTDDELTIIVKKFSL